jgi:UDP-glucose 4-epimerase
VQLLELSQQPNNPLGGETYNIGTGEEITIQHLLESLLRLMGRTELGLQHLPDRPADVPRLWVDATKWRSLTGFEPSVTFEQGLLTCIDYYTRLVQQNATTLQEVEAVNWK